MSTPPIPTAAAELPGPLQGALDEIRAAFFDASEGARSRAVIACRVLLTVLEAPAANAQASAPAAAPPPPAAPAPPHPFDLLLASFVARFGDDVAPDPTVPFLDLGMVNAAFGAFGRVR